MLPNIILSGTELDSHFRFRNPSTERLYNLSDIIMKRLDITNKLQFCKSIEYKTIENKTIKNETGFK